MYKTRHFGITELVHPQILKTLGEENAWMRLDEDCLKDLDTIRDEWFKVHNSGIYVNRIKIGLDSRGLRPPNDPDGAFYSVHKQGKAFDLEPVNEEIEKLYNFVADLIIKGKLIKMNTLENFADTKGWVHVANMNVKEKLKIIYL